MGKSERGSRTRIKGERGGGRWVKGEGGRGVGGQKGEE